MSPTTKATAPRRLSRLRIAEISLCAAGANQHAKALLAKSADTAADLDRRMAALEHQRAMSDAPARLIAKMAARGEELAAAAQGRQYVPTIPDTVVAKGASGGARLVARAATIAKAHREQAAQHVHHLAAAAPTAKASLSPGQRLIEAARERCRTMKAAG